MDLVGRSEMYDFAVVVVVVVVVVVISLFFFFFFSSLFFSSSLFTFTFFFFFFFLTASPSSFLSSTSPTLIVPSSFPPLSPNPGTSLLPSCSFPLRQRSRCYSSVVPFHPLIALNDLSRRLSVQEPLRRFSFFLSNSMNIASIPSIRAE